MMRSWVPPSLTPFSDSCTCSRTLISFTVVLEEEEDED
jgi:hypothetical protein